MAANPRPTSFYDTMRNNHGFIINSVQWTSRHLDLVGCRFEDVGTRPVYAESTQINHKTNDGRNSCLSSPSDAEVLAMNLFPAIKCRRLISILVGKGRTFAYSRQELHSDGTASIIVTDKSAEQQRSPILFPRSVNRPTRLYCVPSS